MNTWKDWLLVIGLCVIVFFVFVGLALLKVDAYGGDPDCLFIKCVKVIH